MSREAMEIALAEANATIVSQGLEIARKDAQIADLQARERSIRAAHNALERQLRETLDSLGETL